MKKRTRLALPAVLRPLVNYLYLSVDGHKDLSRIWSHMANKNPNPKTRWKKGQSGNPSGSVPYPPEIKRIHKFTADELKEMISVLLYATSAECEALAADPNAPKIKKIMATILLKAYEHGSMGQLDMVLNRVIGKVKDDVDVRVFKPSILVRRDGSEVAFVNEPKASGEEE